MLLNCHTTYSYRYGVLSPDEVLQWAKENGFTEVAITDINSTSACLTGLRLADKYGLHVSVGVDFRRDVKQCFVAIARSNNGYLEINRLLSNCLNSGTPIPLEAPEYWQEVVVIYPPESAPRRSLRPYEYIGLKPEDLLMIQWKKGPWTADRIVAMPTCTHLHRKGYNAHRLLRAIDNNVLLSKLPPEQVASDVNQYRTREALLEAYSRWPALLMRSEELLMSCSVSFRFGDKVVSQNLKTYTGSAAKDMALLRKLCVDGVNYRYPKSNKAIFERIERELEVIRDKGFVSYFLINWDIVNYARKKQYFYVGRGSGANSIVAYLLQITDVDPIELDLYFERFINLYRQNPPDFDIDFSWKDRDDITDYIFKRFPHTALLGTYNTFQFRAVVRELGKVFGLPKHEIDRLSEGRFKSAPLDQMSQLVLKYSTYIQDFPSHLGIHAGGILIADGPIEQYVATYLPPKGYPTTQFDMIVAEDVGLHKFDILSQRGLSKIRETIDIVRHNHPSEPPLDMHDIAKFKKDEKVKDLLRNAKALGCFYVESPAMRMLLTKLRVDDYLGLVAASSIIRPGVARSGMMREYILRHRHPEKRGEGHPILLDIMPETYGVMVYQEDVIRVAHMYGGLTLGEADMLRRGMSGKFRSREEFKKVEEKFFDNCAQKGYPELEAREIWRQIESFAGYAFAKGHSASYAVESYQSLFLKAHYPLEYMVAVINNFGGFYRTEVYVHEARMLGATIHPPCVNRGDVHTVIFGKDIYLGFMFLQGMQSEVGVELVEERERNGPFDSLDDFIDRVPIGLDQLTILIRIDAFRFTGKAKRELLWEAYLKVNKQNQEPQTIRMFKSESKAFVLPPLVNDTQEYAFDEMELLGFTLSNPFYLLQNPPINSLGSRDLPIFKNRQVSLYGYLVTVKDTKTANGKRMQFGTFLDQNGDFIDTVHFPPVAAAYPFRGRGIYILKGKVIDEFGFLSLEVISMEKADVIPDPRYSEKKNTLSVEAS